MARTGTVEVPVERPGRPWRALVENPDLWVTPLLIVVGLAVASGTVYGGSLDSLEARALDPANVLGQLAQHLVLTAWSTLLVLVVALPLGLVLSRPRFVVVARIVALVGGFAQALPAFGVLILLGFWRFGLVSAVLGLGLAAFLPVLRNTIVGLQEVDRDLVETARGMGMSARQCLVRVEIPLAIPVIVAGVRVALVLNVGTATLASYIGAGGLGALIQQALLLNRLTVLVVAGSLVAALALLVDWLAGLVERAVAARTG
ncbi:ABC transporter permease [Actinomycetospora corticicola]|uniref:ABC-type proline/glycine betaine transport system permease subunit n=1 Tax=Actinomycetospora corticicola TaxID=663602 RepID=A0A7Y9DXC5_9PSEU|nr:ABC-type proline/glycine betaine transport system permease subunit [Actinomycetospora corticicola]